MNYRNVLNFEWIKFRTLRSSWLTLLGAAITMVVVGLILGYVTSTADLATLEAEDMMASGTVRGYLVAQLVVGVLGALFVTSEYGTGLIQSTFAAVPRRWRVLTAKSVVFGGVVLASMTLASFAAFFAGQMFLTADGYGASLSDPGAIRAIAGVGLYLTLIGLLGGAIGWIFRSTAGAITAFVGLLVILPLLVSFLPAGIGGDIARFLPEAAAEGFVTSGPEPDALAPWAGVGVLALWVGVSYVVAMVSLRRRDVT